MSKRLTRIAAKNILAKLGNHAELMQLNATTRSGYTFYGNLISVTNEFLTLKDNRDYLHKLAMEDIFEVVYDEKSKPGC